MSGDEHDDGFDDIPLQHKRPFGSGLRRNEIKFVPASSSEGGIVSSNPSSTGGKTQGQSISDFYLNMVLKNPSESAASTQALSSKTGIEEEICEVCKMPMRRSLSKDSPNANTGDDTTIQRKASHHHEASIAHQVCLTHSHPPSALDRTRMGLSVLESQGWDPDSRTGLGAEGQGVHYPIKLKPKDDNLGIGVVVPKDFQPKKKEKPKFLDAKKVRKMAAEDRKRTDQLQKQIFGKVDLERYLGSGG